MKKILSVLLSLILICISLAFVGCGYFPSLVKPFEEGIYESFEYEDEPFLKARLIIQPITKKQFKKADGINVIRNPSKREGNKTYYSFELFFYDDIEEDYVQAEISNIHHLVIDQPDEYTGDIEYSTENLQLNGEFGFCNFCFYDHVTIRCPGDDGIELHFKLVS